MGPTGPWDKDLPEVPGVDGAEDRVKRLHAWLAEHEGCTYGKGDKGEGHRLYIRDRDGEVIASAFSLRELLIKVGAP